MENLYLLSTSKVLVILISHSFENQEIDSCEEEYYTAEILLAKLSEIVND